MSDTSNIAKRAFPAAILALTISASAIGAPPSAAQTPIPMAERNAALRGIDANNAVLVLVDYTSGLYPVVDTIEVDTMLNNAVAAAKIAKTFDLPILILGDEGGFYGDMHPPIKTFLGEGEQVHERTTPSAWDSGTFRAALEATGRTQVVIGGISTDNCTFLTSLDLLQNGYDVFVMTDISGTDSVQSEQAALMRLDQAGASFASWIMFGSELLETWESPEGAALGTIYDTHINGPSPSAYGSTSDDATIGDPESSEG